MSRQKILQIAEEENGTAEYPAKSNKTKYGKWYGIDGVRWCAIFVSWVFDQAGHKLPKINKDKGYDSCSDAFTYWKKRNQITENPIEGDIVLYDFDKDHGNISDHTGIFVKWIKKGKTFEAWEGNTSNDKVKDKDGGRVMLQIRDIIDVRGFADPGVFD